MRRLGAGGAGEVWLAQDRERGRLVALKILFPSLACNAAAVAALERECACARGLDHPNILRVEAVHRCGREAWLSMEYAPGGDLTQLRGASALEVLRAATPIAAALAYAHSAGFTHRDVKSSNVLLAADGTPKLADFGMALAIAASPAAHAGRGSPYSMSPQQLDGRAASPGDDVYGCGAMLYELLTGYPPFYPDATPERIRTETPAALPAATPAALARLVARMLAKSPQERPEMSVVEHELSAALAALQSRAPSPMSNEPITPDRRTAVHIEPPAAPPLAARGEPLRGEWRRAPGVESVGAPVRRRISRRALGGAAIAFALACLAMVFFALPRLVESERSVRYAPAASTVATPSAELGAQREQIDFAALARAKQAADERRAAVDERLRQLTARGAQLWGAAEQRTAMSEFAAGAQAYERREYAAAAERFAGIEPLTAALEKRAGQALQEQLAAGAQALETGRSQDARAAFELAARIDPENRAAAAGLKRAAVLDEALGLAAAGERLEQAGDLSAALASFRQALALDAQTRGAASGAARVEARLAGDAFASAMARGYSALAAADYARARSAFEAARRIRPQAPEIARALQQIEQEQRTVLIAAKLAEARKLEARERWADALAEYRAVLDLDGAVAAAKEGAERSAPRAQLNAQLEMYLTQPERLFSQPVRAAAREALAQARRIPDPGPLLQRQIATLTDWAARAERPVRIALESDNLTHVTIYRVGELGAFTRRSLELAPGSYTVVGARPGYRDVRRQITVGPGAALEPIVIRCEERI